MYLYCQIASHPVESSKNGAYNWTVLGMRCHPYSVSWDAVIENNTVIFKNITSLVNVGEQPIFNISSRVSIKEFSKSSFHKTEYQYVCILFQELVWVLERNTIKCTILISRFFMLETGLNALDLFKEKPMD